VFLWVWLQFAKIKLAIVYIFIEKVKIKTIFHYHVESNFDILQTYFFNLSFAYKKDFQRGKKLVCTFFQCKINFLSFQQHREMSPLNYNITGNLPVSQKPQKRNAFATYEPTEDLSS